MMDEHVLLLAPSEHRGGGIERYVSTVESVFKRFEVPYRRLNLIRHDRLHGLDTKLRFVQEVRRAVRCGSGPTRLLVAHCNLLPVVSAVTGLENYSGTTVILHGREIWSRGKLWARSVLRRPDVRVVAVSNFSAGGLVTTCPANVLPPGVSPAWYRMLVDAGGKATRVPGEFNVVTTFRLEDWRGKGLPTLLDALWLAGDDRLRLTICGTGYCPSELVEAIAPYPWCHLTPGLSDRDLAQVLANADVFVLATRTRQGARASGEGFGLVLLEAQLAGTPVVAPAYGGSGDAFLPGVTGLAPLDETPEALAAALDTLLRDDEGRQHMGEAAAQWSRTRFEPEAYGRQVMRVLLNRPLLKPHRRSLEVAAPQV
jgi:glycosyltransferase involved in cell wall biosynthesis